MIKEDISSLTVRTTVTRICDDCGVEEKKTLSEIKYSKLKKLTGKDYCKKCSYKYRILPDLSGDKSPCYKNGLSLNGKNGYLRINKTGEYYHKVLFGNFLGRKITKEEQVHHIDFDKLNNSIDNLFLCKNKKHHYKVHYKLEMLILSLLGKYIYFDKQKKLYVVDDPKSKITNFKFNYKNVKSIIECKWGNGKFYKFGYLGNRKYKTLHRLIYEQFLGRKLIRKEHIHHIDGYTLNNDINNLILLQIREHKICHNSLGKCAKILFHNNIIDFKEGVYYV